MDRFALDAVRPFVVADVSYKCHGIDDEGSFVGYWDGEMDGWGKLTFHEVVNSGRSGPGPGPFYLFHDELTSVEYLDGKGE